MMPNDALSAVPIKGQFLPPRASVRFSPTAGMYDTHFGGVAIGNPSLGIVYQLWGAYTDGHNVWVTAPNTPAFILLANVGAVWVALAFDQNANIFVAYADKNGNASYYWFNSIVQGYVTSQLPGVVPRVFAALDDNRSALSQTADILLCYVRAGVLYMRQQRDRYGVEYTLGAAPAALVQVGMSTVDRFQFAFQNVQGNSVVPPVELAMPAGVNPPS
jgi:hypothetical protein